MATDTTLAAAQGGSDGCGSSNSPGKIAHEVATVKKEIAHEQVTLDGWEVL